MKEITKFVLKSIQWSEDGLFSEIKKVEEEEEYSEGSVAPIPCYRGDVLDDIPLSWSEQHIERSPSFRDFIFPLCPDIHTEVILCEKTIEIMDDPKTPISCAVCGKKKNPLRKFKKGSWRRAPASWIYGTPSMWLDNACRASASRHPDETAEELIARKRKKRRTR